MIDRGFGVPPYAAMNNSLSLLRGFYCSIYKNNKINYIGEHGDTVSMPPVNGGEKIERLELFWVSLAPFQFSSLFLHSFIDGRRCKLATSEVCSAIIAM